MKRILLSSITLAFVLTSCSLINPNQVKKDQEKAEEIKFEAKELTLKQRIDEYAELAKTKISPTAKETMITATNNLRKSGISDKFLKVGDKAPNFKLESFAGKEFELYDLLEKGPVVINFYRGGWCPYCNLDLKALNEKYPAIKAKGAELLAISPEIPDRSAILANKNKLSFPLLYDKRAKVADKYNLVFELDESLKPIYKGFGIDLEQANANNNWELPVPATYIVGKDRLIKFAYADVDYKNRAEPADIVDAI